VAKINTIELYLHQALELFYKNDLRSLRDKSGNFVAQERSCVFRIAHYLQTILSLDKRFADVVVDCEYGNATSDTGKLLKKHMDSVGIRVYASQHNEDCVFPDLIIHKRQKHNKNYLVAEFKGCWNAGDWDNDAKKLKRFTKEPPTNNLEQYFNYKLGAFVVLGKHKYCITRFKNGDQVSGDENIDNLKQRKEQL